MRSTANITLDQQTSEHVRGAHQHYEGFNNHDQGRIQDFVKGGGDLDSPLMINHYTHSLFLNALYI